MCVRACVCECTLTCAYGVCVYMNALPPVRMCLVFVCVCVWCEYTLTCAYVCLVFVCVCVNALSPVRMVFLVHVFGT